VPDLLDVRQLTTIFRHQQGVATAVNNIGFTIAAGETLALVGESGCGKSVTAYSIMRLIRPPGEIASGQVIFNGRDLLQLPEEEMRKLRGNSIAMIFQEPMTSLNPVLNIGSQIAEGLCIHRGMSSDEARLTAIELLNEVGIPAPEIRYRDYPHQLSGGMRQRVMIAMALACSPQLLIADEPTTALDVTIQAQILELLDRLMQNNRMAMLLITHDLGIVAERAVHTAIMYAGRIVEYAATPLIFKEPKHPYTTGLLNALPENARPGERLPSIPGNVPAILGNLPGCGFCDRCLHKEWRCAEEVPPLTEVSANHWVRCWKFS
jgi:peptide/nickel transport system ATP-binding protein